MCEINRKKVLRSRLNGMKQRCTNPKIWNYNYYGGKGITVCDEWANDFSSFYRWSIENGFSKELTIDRKDGNKGYSPDNCRWVTKKEQQANTKSTKFVEYKGERISLSSLCDRKNISINSVHSRLNLGWSIEKAINTPVKKHRGSFIIKNEITLKIGKLINRHGYKGLAKKLDISLSYVYALESGKSPGKHLYNAIKDCE